MRLLAVIWLICLNLSLSFAQADEQERGLINNYTEDANRLIWHINKHIQQLSAFQEDLNAWYLAGGASTHTAPIFSLEKFDESQLTTLNAIRIHPSNPVFNYQSTFTELKRQVILFDNLCKQIQNLPRAGSAQDFYERAMKALFQIDNMAGEMVNLCYDFSLSCAVNYGKEKLPQELEDFKSLVGQAKNVIMAMRDNDPVQCKAYLNQLNMALIACMGNQQLTELKRMGKFKISEEEMQSFAQQMLEAADLIGFWAEQYIQSSYEQDEVRPLLQSEISAFNIFEGQAGCSGAYNALVSESKNQYLLYTEEPMFFQMDMKTKQKEALATMVVKEDVMPVEIPVSNPVSAIDSVKKPEETVVFDAEDITTLDGSLPNNIVIMMDVSASMKLTGKLPLLKSSILHLVDIMRAEDNLSLLAYSGQAEVLIANAGIEDKSKIKAVLDTLHSSGGTDIQNGLELGYETIFASYMEEGNNRIIIATDGEFGVRSSLQDLVLSHRDDGVFLSIFQYNEPKDQSTNQSLADLATLGKGSYQLITTSEEALNVLMREVKKQDLD